MKLSLLSFLMLTLLTVGTVNADTVTINLVDTTGTIGDLIDGLTDPAEPVTFDVPNDAGTGLTISVISVGGPNADINTGGTAGLGVDSDGDSSPFFESGESVSFAFNLDVSLNSIDFFALGSTDTFLINGTAITAADETASGDFVELTTPIDIAAGSSLTFAGGAGSAAIQNITLHVTPVPEPASAILLAGIGLVGLSRRRR